MKKSNDCKKIKNGQKVSVPATYQGLTEDGLAIVSIGTVDNYILTLDKADIQELSLSSKQPT